MLVPYSAMAVGEPAPAQAFETEEVTMSSPADLMAQGEDERLLPEEAPAKEIVGRSPTQIAFERLRHDKVAVVCFCIVTLMVLLTIFAPLICKALGITWDVGKPESVSITTGLDAYNMPVAEFGPPYGSFTWDHPLGIAPGVATDNLAYLLYGMRDSLFISVIATTISVQRIPGPIARPGPDGCVAVIATASSPPRRASTRRPMRRQPPRSR